MLHLIPAPLHRRLYRLAHELRLRWWRVAKPRHRSVLVVAFDERDHVLLVRHSYGRPVWALPGGGVGRGEEPALAAMREIREELGCGLSDLFALKARSQQVSGSRELQHRFVATIAGEPVADQREIVAAELFDPAALPPDCARYVGRLVEQAMEARRYWSEKR